MGRGGLPRPARVAARGPGHQPGHVRPRPARHRQVHPRQTAGHRRRRLRVHSCRPWRHQTGLHDADRPSRRPGDPHRPWPGHDQPTRYRPSRRRAAAALTSAGRQAALGGPLPPPVPADGPRHPGTRRGDHQRRGSHPRPRHRPARRAPRRATPAHRRRRAHRRRAGPGCAAFGGPRGQLRPVPPEGCGSGVHPGSAVHRLAGRGIRRANQQTARPRGAGRVGGHLPGRRGRRQAADRRDAMHLGVRVCHGRRRRSVGRAGRRAPPGLSGGDGRALAGVCAALPGWSNTPTP